ncbi:putative uvi-1 protein [Rosellinia necatrix]|uniref:Putative uvi-1 protein n=1 Tax=Rosellinia necatrix TaxID=77044 RepID=A0A1W2TNH4_ROSNE|nr:putative uvi-1 protein [Rosellinia necatrix]
MLFSKLFATGAAMAATAMAALTPAQIATSLKQVTDLSRQLQGPAASITIVNAPLIVIGQGPFPQIISGFTQIVTVATSAISQFDGTAPITVEADATLVFDAFRTFVRVHQDLLNILIGKAGILSKVPFIGPPVAAVLRQVEGVVDAIAITLINLVESRTKDLASEANALGASLDVTIKAYEGLSV